MSGQNPTHQIKRATWYTATPAISESANKRPTLNAVHFHERVSCLMAAMVATHGTNVICATRKASAVAAAGLIVPDSCPAC